MRKVYCPLIVILVLSFALSCASKQTVVASGPDIDLLKAASTGDAAGIEKAIFEGADPQRADENGRTPLYAAVASQNIEAVKVLLQPKADFVAKKSQRDGVAILNYLNNTGSKNNNWIGASLPDAIQGSMAESFDFKRLKPDSTQKTANRVIGKNTTYTDSLFKTLGSKTAAAILISGSYTLLPGGKDASIKTQVFATIENKLLFESEIHATLDSNIFDALNQVAREIVERLKEYASSAFGIRLKNTEQPLIVNVNARDRGDVTPLTFATSAGTTAIVALLIKSGADYQSDTVAAINYGDENAGVAIVQQSPEINYRMVGGKTPLIQAAFKGRSRITDALLQKKADVNLQDLYGFTALMYAAQEGHVEIVKKLVAAKANVNIKTWDSFTALEAVRRKGHTEIIEVLGKAGAK